jgi:hypothetical protein
MASTAFSAVTALVTGKALAAGIGIGQTTASTETCTITAPGGKELDLSRLVLRLATSAGSATTNVSIGVGSIYSGISLGAFRVVVPTATTVYVGGKDFESARFKNATAQSITITVTTGASAINWEAVLLPAAFNN